MEKAFTEKQLKGFKKHTFEVKVEEEKLMQTFLKLWFQSDSIYKDDSNPIGIEWLKKNNSCIFNNKPSLKSRIN